MDTPGVPVMPFVGGLVQYGGGFGLHAPDICHVVSYVPGGWEKTAAAKFAALGIEEGDDN